MKLLRLPRAILFGALAIGALLAITAISLSQSQGTAQADPEGSGKIIGVCCAWNSELSDGELTYSIAGGDATVQGVVRTAVLEWATAVGGLTLTETNDTSVSNVEIKFRNGGGQIQGQARRKFDDAGLIREVDLVVSGKAFGDPNNADTVAQITKHEFGHALGTGHANFSGDLMSTTVTAGVGTISDCDVDAVLAANAWFFGGGVPAAPIVDHVHCGPAPEPDPTPEPGDVEIVTVDSIGCAVIRNRLIYTITIVVDGDSDRVPDAIVTGTRLDPKGRLFTFEGETNADGQVSFRAGRPANGEHLITVLDVTGDGIDFVSGPGSSGTCTV